MTRTCCVPTCKQNTSKSNPDEKISYHCFPKNKELRKEWILSVSEDETKLIKIHNFSQVCSKHFLENDYWSGVKSGKRLLKDNSVPSQLIPNSDKKKARKRLKTSVEFQHVTSSKTMACQTNDQVEIATPVLLSATVEENLIIPDVQDTTILLKPKIEVNDVINVSVTPIPSSTNIVDERMDCLVPNAEKNQKIPIDDEMIDAEEIKSLKCKLIENEKEKKRLETELDTLKMKCDEERRENRFFVEKLQFISKNIKSSSRKVCEGDSSTEFGKVENEEVLQVAVGQLQGTLNRWERKLRENSLRNPLSSL